MAEIKSNREREREITEREGWRRPPWHTKLAAGNDVAEARIGVALLGDRGS